MAPRTRTTVYSTPSHKRPQKLQSTTDKKELNDKFYNNETVGVYLRLRPSILDEPTLLQIDDHQVKTNPPDGSAHRVYYFTQVFNDAPQSTIFDKVARPLVEDFITLGKDGLLFTYGITGSGKTYTMEGLRSDPGIIYRSIDFIFNSIPIHQHTERGVIESDGENSYCARKMDRLYPNLGRKEALSTMPSVVKWKNRAKEMSQVSVDSDSQYCLFISLIELYNKHVIDLLEEFGNGSIEKEKKKREIRTDERGISYVANAVEVEVKSADEAVELYTRGVRRRKTGATALNQESSRGHCVLNLKLVKVSYSGEFVSSQLCLVDLAGSERVKRSGATGGTLHEAGNINNSLIALRKCIRDLRDKKPAAVYRDCTLTRLFESYFKGHGSVCMILCVKPSTEDFHENKMAMDFGLLTQDVAVDYASPPKRSKGGRNFINPSCDLMYEYLDRKLSHHEPNLDLNDSEYFQATIEKLKTNRERLRKYIEAATAAQAEVRQSIQATADQNKDLQRHYEELRKREEQFKMMEANRNKVLRELETKVERLRDENHSKERQVNEINTTRKILHKMTVRQAQYEKLFQDIVNLMEAGEDRSSGYKKVMDILSTVPSAPEMKPLQSSSPMNIPNPSTSETTESHTPPTTTNSSAEPMEFQIKNLERNGPPVVNIKHNRSLSCDRMKWIHHKPSGTIDTGTVFKPKIKNSRSIKDLRSSDILRRDAGGYSVVHQDADNNGDVETSVYKGHIIPTVCGGAQVILDDIETMRQESPKRKRAASDAGYTH